MADPLKIWREDPLLNEHHEHWHLVYPYAGVPEAQAPQAGYSYQLDAAHKLWKDRHGELFAYMHAQLLARYGAERLSTGLPPVEEFWNYEDPIPEGCKSPGRIRLWNGAVKDVGSRPAGAQLKDLTTPTFSGRPGARLEQQTLFRDRIYNAAHRSTFASTSSRLDVDMNALSERIEPTDRSSSAYFGALHNDGHLHFGLYDNNEGLPGAMFYEAITLTDPIFYRWHAHIDRFFRVWQETLTPYDFTSRSPVVAESVRVDCDGEPPQSLRTEIRTRPVRTRPDRDHTVIDYIAHPDFTYRIEVRSDAVRTIGATIRLFLVPDQLKEVRTAWIELDKFRVDLDPGKNLVIRASDMSSVVRHPVIKAEALETGLGLPDERGSTPGCRCGWPYTLLLPRGNDDGMSCKVMIMVCPGDDLKHSAIGVTSASYCGLQDDDYPDVRSMGYPFDRPFERSIMDTIESEPHMLATDIVIRHEQNQ